MAKRTIKINITLQMDEILEDAMAGVTMALIRRNEGRYPQEHALQREEAFWRDIMKSIIGAVVQTIDVLNDDRTA